MPPSQDAPPPAARAPRLSGNLRRTLRGVMLMVLATGCIAGMHGLVRHMTGELHPFVIAFFRNLVVPLFLLPLFVRAGWSVFRSNRIDLHAWRAAVGVIALLSWFYALSLLPLAEATALNFTSTIFVTIGAALFLRERVRLHRWSAVAAGFIGVLIILQPGRDAASLGGLLVLFSAMFWAASLVIGKAVTSHDGTVTIVAYMAVFTAVLSFIPALLVWQTPTLAQFVLLLAIGATGTAGYLLLTQALKEAEATVVLPLDFLRLVWASLFGYVLFSEVLDVTTWLGAALIALSAAYIAWREAQRKPSLSSSQAAPRPPD